MRFGREVLGLIGPVVVGCCRRKLSQKPPQLFAQWDDEALTFSSKLWPIWKTWVWLEEWLGMAHTSLSMGGVPCMCGVGRERAWPAVPTAPRPCQMSLT